MKIKAGEDIWRGVSKSKHEGIVANHVSYLFKLHILTERFTERYHFRVFQDDARPRHSIVPIMSALWPMDSRPKSYISDNMIYDFETLTGPVSEKIGGSSTWKPYFIPIFVVANAITIERYRVRLLIRSAATFPLANPLPTVC
jgi:hypothetical protein